MDELTVFGTIVLVVAGGLLLALLLTKVGERFPVPEPLIFLLLAAVASDIFPQLGERLSILEVERIGVVALIVILFNGGTLVGWRRFRVAAVPIFSLGIFGTFATAAIIAVAAHYLFDFSWTIAGILGAALAPTDPAVMFSVLGNKEIRGRAGTILEGESGVNDPVGIALMIGMIELATQDDGIVLGRRRGVHRRDGRRTGRRTASALLRCCRCCGSRSRTRGSTRSGRSPSPASSTGSPRRRTARASSPSSSPGCSSATPTCRGATRSSGSTPRSRAWRRSWSSPRSA